VAVGIQRQSVLAGGGRSGLAASFRRTGASNVGIAGWSSPGVDGRHRASKRLWRCASRQRCPQLDHAPGAAAALSLLFDDDSKWDVVLEGVATGTPEWLSIAADLRSVSDAHATETLVMAVQEALPNSPRGVAI